MGDLPRPLHSLWNLIDAGARLPPPVTTPPTSPSWRRPSTPCVTGEARAATAVGRSAHTAPGGDFAAAAIPNADLDISAVPRRGESWDAVSDFALSYDGYGYWDNLPSLAGRVLQRWTRRRSLPATLDELRGCLFYEQRRWHHFGEEPTGRSAEYMWAVIDAIAALTAPVASTVNRLPDPRRAIASETHVKLVVTRAVGLRPLPTSTPTVRPKPARQGRLVPVPAAEAHVRLVSAIEDEANAVSRHPAGHASRRSSGRPAGNPAQHPSMTGATRDLLPMPSADPLPKPPVIERRSRRTGSGPKNRPGGAVNAIRTPGDTWPSNRSGWGLDDGPGDHTPGAAPAKITPLCREFHAEDPAYRKWVDTHPDGFVLHQRRCGDPQDPDPASCRVRRHRPSPRNRHGELGRAPGVRPQRHRSRSMERGARDGPARHLSALLSLTGRATFAPVSPAVSPAPHPGRPARAPGRKTAVL